MRHPGRPIPGRPIPGHRAPGRRTLALAAAGLLAAPALVRAQGRWKPTRPVNMLVPFSAGGPTDVMARLLALKLTDKLGQTVTVENVGGAGGILGTQRLARAQPDGQTIGLGHMGTHAANVAFYKRLPYDPVADFVPLGQYATNPMVLAVRPGLADDVAGLKRWIAENPGKLTVANAGNGSVSFLGSLLFDRISGAKAVLVPYRGAGPALQDTMNGVTDAIVDQAITVIPQAGSGTLRALAVTVPARLPQLPDVPTATEAGLPGLDIAVWNGAYLPRGTPASIADSLSAVLAAVLDDPLIRERFAALAVQVPPPAERGPEPLRRLIESETVRWKAIAEAAGVVPE